MNTIKIKTPLEYGFFNCADGTEDRVYTAENFTGYLSAIICDGILDTWGDCFSLSYSGSSLTVGSGYAWIGGHYAILPQSQTIDLTSYSDSGLSRVIAVGISCDTSTGARACSFEIASGLAGGSDKPAFVNTDTKKYLTLCYVKLNAGGTISSLEDVRDNGTLCGYVRCILGKCKVSEILDALNGYQNSVSSLTQQVEDLSNRLSEIEEITGTGGVSLRTAGAIGETVSYAAYTDGNVRLVGSGDTYDYNATSNKSPFYDDRTTSAISIASGVTRVGSYCFTGCKSESVSLPNTLKSIGSHAFTGDADFLTLPPTVGGLRSISIPASVITLEDYALAKCRFTSISLPQTVTTLGNYVLYGCKLLTSAEVLCPTLGDFLFTYCSGLQSLTIGRSVVAFGSTMFTYCDSLTTITYAGTKAQWNAIQKPDDWISADTSSGHHNGTLERISCTDGAFVWNGQTKQWEEET